MIALEHASTPSYLQKLNPPQREAVEHFTGPILVLAGAGSGKTRVLTNRVAHLILKHGVRPSSILAVTFTNKAADEMKERLHHLLGSNAQGLWISTFHSAALRMLRRHARLLEYSNDFVIYDEQDTKSVLKQVIRELGIDEKKFPPQLFSRFIDQCKNAFVLPDGAHKAAKDFAGRQQAEVYERYQRELMKANAMDFGDLLVNAVLLLKNFPDVLQLYRNTLHFILVDEFQDTNKVQYMFIRYLSEPRRNLLVVGDDDQSIYAFRGATIRNILDFEKDFPETKIVKLEQNYRSSGNILAAAHAVIEKNSGRKSKKLWTEKGEGPSITTYLADDETDEASFVVNQIHTSTRAGLPYSKIAIFYRTNAQSRALEEALVSRGIPYRIYGGLKFYDRKEIKDILGYLRLLVNPQDSQAFARTLNTPPRGIGTQTYQSILTEAQDSGISHLEAARAVAQRNRNVAGFIQLIDEFKEMSVRVPLSELIQTIITKTEYGPKLQALKDPASESRLENLQELVAIGASMELGADSPFEALQQFLDRVSLTAAADLPAEGRDGSREDSKPNSVSLMTLHLAKGLEFPMVFLTGMEEGLLPHYRSLLDPVAIEEERRLCYVGITRAMEQLFVTRARHRGMFSAGEGFGVGGMMREVSRFVRDIPGQHLQHAGPDFFSTVSSFAYDDIEEEPGRRRSYSNGSRNLSSKRKATAPSLPPGRPALKTADQLNNEKPHADWSPSLPVAKPEDLYEGVAVVHPTFGRGTVEAVEGDRGNNSGKLKIAVKFAASAQARKLVYKFAKLSLIE